MMYVRTPDTMCYFEKIKPRFKIRPYFICQAFARLSGFENEKIIYAVKPALKGTSI